MAIENLTKAIEKDNAQRDALATKEMLRGLCAENPFSKEHWNLTRQAQAAKHDPKLAAALEACANAGSVPSSMVDQLTPELREAFLSVIKTCADINDKALNGKTGEEA